MTRLHLMLATLALAACSDVGETHHVNETGGFCLTVPSDFEERRISIDSAPVTEGTDLYDLTTTKREVDMTLTVGVNRYDPNLPSGKMFIEYIWRLEDDGTLTPTGRKVTVPEGGHTYPPVAISLFFDRNHETLYFFRMDLRDDGFEDLFVDIVGSFQSLR